MKFFLWGRGVIIFDAAKFERRSFRRSGDTARAKLRIYYASNTGCFYVLMTCFWP